VIERVAVLRALPGLGDLLCAVPALRALRGAWPSADVTLIGLPQTAWFSARFARYVNDHLELRSWPCLPETVGPPEEAERFLAEARARSFDVAIQLHGDGRVTNELIGRLGSRCTAGLARPGAPRPDSERFPDVPVTASEVERTLLPLRALGVYEQGRHLELPESRSEREAAVGVTAGVGRYAVVHAGATLASRRWDPDGFAVVGDHLAERRLAVVLTGVVEERPIARAVAARMSATPVDLVGRLSLGATAAVVRRAQVLVTNDTGMSHLAAAVGTPSVVVFRVTDPSRWKPEADRHVAVIDDGDVERTAARVLAAAARA
jgi:ADP-heptose:LPS heptosyltransferase